MEFSPFARDGTMLFICQWMTLKNGQILVTLSLVNVEIMKQQRTFSGSSCLGYLLFIFPEQFHFILFPFVSSTLEHRLGVLDVFSVKQVYLC